MTQVLVLVGLPGCGKTIFSSRVVALNAGWVCINQDVIGSRSVCETEALKALKAGKKVIIDRCNFDEDERKIWVKVAEEVRCPIDSLFFAVNAKVCKERVKNRKGHPSGVEGKFGAEVVARFDRIMTRPSTYEGFRFCHDILPHLNISGGSTIEAIYCAESIKKIIALFPPAKAPEPCHKHEEKKPGPCSPNIKVEVDIEKTKKVEIDVTESKKKECVEVKTSEGAKKIEVDVKVESKDKKPAPPPQSTQVTYSKTSDEFWSAPWANKQLTVIKPNEGFGTYKETKAMWEDEQHTQHFNHSLFNEQAEREDGKGRKVEKRSRHLQHSDHMVNPTRGTARAFDHMTLDKDQKGHQMNGDGTKEHFHDKTHFHHQHEHEEDVKMGLARTYEHKHMSNIRHIHKGDPDKARTEAFEHRSFNYAFKGGSGLDPEKIMMSSSKNKLRFEDEIKASFHNLPMQERFKFVQNVKWETELPTKPNFSVFK
ncbi:Transcription factor [Zancudomyces culisetae]|uniref:Transcription factor n=1 Tax=Zancudomyces culisetae TaxID=1213189 RepID=A0A1R1PYC4_ZANCU|nr:Transcription factor [Zancudomyces culisetae]|eukprot:OMH85950.1 Transcription factor [Zancudomyces culisetae]